MPTVNWLALSLLMAALQQALSKAMIYANVIGCDLGPKLHTYW